jgi:peptide deformylase
VDYQTIDGEPAHLDADDMVARIIQHEYDHLDGILFVDRISPVRRQLLRKQLKALAKSQGKRS